MTHLKARIAFTRSVGILLASATAFGLDSILNECLRSPEAAKWNATHCRVPANGRRCEATPDSPIHRVPAAGSHTFRPIGIANSVHCLGLAVDLYFIDGGSISNARDVYARLGVVWKSLHPLARWGGDFDDGHDVGHYSFEWKGRK